MPRFDTQGPTLTIRGPTRVSNPLLVQHPIRTAHATSGRKLLPAPEEETIPGLGVMDPQVRKLAVDVHVLAHAVRELVLVLGGRPADVRGLDLEEQLPADDLWVPILVPGGPGPVQGTRLQLHQVFQGVRPLEEHCVHERARVEVFQADSRLSPQECGKCVRLVMILLPTELFAVPWIEGVERPAVGAVYLVVREVLLQHRLHFVVIFVVGSPEAASGVGEEMMVNTLASEGEGDRIMNLQ